MSDYYSSDIDEKISDSDNDYDSSVDDTDEKSQTEIDEEEKQKYDLENNKEFDPFYNDFLEFEEMSELMSSKLSVGTNQYKKKEMKIVKQNLILINMNLLN